MPVVGSNVTKAGSRVSSTTGHSLNDVESRNQRSLIDAQALQTTPLWKKKKTRNPPSRDRISKAIALVRARKAAARDPKQVSSTQTQPTLTEKKTANPNVAQPSITESTQNKSKKSKSLIFRSPVRRRKSSGGRPAREHSEAKLSLTGHKNKIQRSPAINISCPSRACSLSNLAMKSESAENTCSSPGTTIMNKELVATPTSPRIHHATKVAVATPSSVQQLSPHGAFIRNIFASRVSNPDAADFAVPLPEHRAFVASEKVPSSLMIDNSEEKTSSKLADSSKDEVFGTNQPIKNPDETKEEFDEHLCAEANLLRADSDSSSMDSSYDDKIDPETLADVGKFIDSINEPLRKSDERFQLGNVEHTKNSTILPFAQETVSKAEEVIDSPSQDKNGIHGRDAFAEVISFNSFSNVKEISDLVQVASGPGSCEQNRISPRPSYDFSDVLSSQPNTCLVNQAVLANIGVFIDSLNKKESMDDESAVFSEEASSVPATSVVDQHVLEDVGRFIDSLSNLKRGTQEDGTDVDGLRVVDSIVPRSSRDQAKIQTSTNVLNTKAEACSKFCAHGGNQAEPSLFADNLGNNSLFSLATSEDDEVLSSDSSYDSFVPEETRAGIKAFIDSLQQRNQPSTIRDEDKLLDSTSHEYSDRETEKRLNPNEEQSVDETLSWKENAPPERDCIRTSSHDAGVDEDCVGGDFNECSISICDSETINSQNNDVPFTQSRPEVEEFLRNKNVGSGCDSNGHQTLKPAHKEDSPINNKKLKQAHVHTEVLPHAEEESNINDTFAFEEGDLFEKSRGNQVLNEGSVGSNKIGGEIEDKSHISTVDYIISSKSETIVSQTETQLYPLLLATNLTSIDHKEVGGQASATCIENAQPTSKRIAKIGCGVVSINGDHEVNGIETTGSQMLISISRDEPINHSHLKLEESRSEKIASEGGIANDGQFFQRNRAHAGSQKTELSEEPTSISKNAGDQEQAHNAVYICCQQGSEGKRTISASDEEITSCAKPYVEKDNREPQTIAPSSQHCVDNTILMTKPETLLTVGMPPICSREGEEAQTGKNGNDVKSNRELGLCFQESEGAFAVTDSRELDIGEGVSGEVANCDMKSARSYKNEKECDSIKSDDLATSCITEVKQGFSGIKKVDSSQAEETASMNYNVDPRESIENRKPGSSTSVYSIGNACTILTVRKSDGSWLRVGDSHTVTQDCSGKMASPDLICEESNVRHKSPVHASNQHLWNGRNESQSAVGCRNEDHAIELEATSASKDTSLASDVASPTTGHRLVEISSHNCHQERASNSAPFDRQNDASWTARESHHESLFYVGTRDVGSTDKDNVMFLETEVVEEKSSFIESTVTLLNDESNCIVHRTSHHMPGELLEKAIRSQSEGASSMSDIIDAHHEQRLCENTSSSSPKEKDGFVHCDSQEFEIWISCKSNDWRFQLDIVDTKDRTREIYLRDSEDDGHSATLRKADAAIFGPEFDGSQVLMNEDSSGAMENGSQSASGDVLSNEVTKTDDSRNNNRDTSDADAALFGFDNVDDRTDRELLASGIVASSKTKVRNHADQDCKVWNISEDNSPEPVCVVERFESKGFSAKLERTNSTAEAKCTPCLVSHGDEPPLEESFRSSTNEESALLVEPACQFTSRAVCSSDEITATKEPITAHSEDMSLNSDSPCPLFEFAVPGRAHPNERAGNVFRFNGQECEVWISCRPNESTVELSANDIDVGSPVKGNDNIESETPRTEPSRTFETMESSGTVAQGNQNASGKVCVDQAAQDIGTMPAEKSDAEDYASMCRDVDKPIDEVLLATCSATTQTIREGHCDRQVWAKGNCLSWLGPELTEQKLLGHKSSGSSQSDINKVCMEIDAIEADKVVERIPASQPKDIAIVELPKLTASMSHEQREPAKAVCRERDGVVRTESAGSEPRETAAGYINKDAFLMAAENKSSGAIDAVAQKHLRTTDACNSPFAKLATTDEPLRTAESRTLFPNVSRDFQLRMSPDKEDHEVCLEEAGNTNGTLGVQSIEAFSSQTIAAVIKNENLKGTCCDSEEDDGWDLYLKLTVSSMETVDETENITAFFSRQKACTDTIEVVCVVDEEDSLEDSLRKDEVLHATLNNDVDRLTHSPSTVCSASREDDSVTCGEDLAVKLNVSSMESVDETENITSFFSRKLTEWRQQELSKHRDILPKADVANHTFAVDTRISPVVENNVAKHPLEESKNCTEEALSDYRSRSTSPSPIFIKLVVKDESDEIEGPLLSLQAEGRPNTCPNEGCSDAVATQNATCAKEHLNDERILYDPDTNAAIGTETTFSQYSTQAEIDMAFAGQSELRSESLANNTDLLNVTEQDATLATDSTKEHSHDERISQDPDTIAAVTLENTFTQDNNEVDLAVAGQSELKPESYSNKVDLLKVTEQVARFATGSENGDPSDDIPWSGVPEQHTPEENEYPREEVSIRDTCRGSEIEVLTAPEDDSICSKHFPREESTSNEGDPRLVDHVRKKFLYERRLVPGGVCDEPHPAEDVEATFRPGETVLNDAGLHCGSERGSRLEETFESKETKKRSTHMAFVLPRLVSEGVEIYSTEELESCLEETNPNTSLNGVTPLTVADHDSRRTQEVRNEKRFHQADHQAHECLGEVLHSGVAQEPPTESDDAVEVPDIIEKPVTCKNGGCGARCAKCNEREERILDKRDEKEIKDAQQVAPELVQNVVQYNFPRSLAGCAKGSFAAVATKTIECCGTASKCDATVATETIECCGTASKCDAKERDASCAKEIEIMIDKSSFKAYKTEIGDAKKTLREDIVRNVPPLVLSQPGLEGFRLCGPTEGIETVLATDVNTCPNAAELVVSECYGSRGTEVDSGESSLLHADPTSTKDLMESFNQDTLHTARCPISMSTVSSERGGVSVEGECTGTEAVRSVTKSTENNFGAEVVLGSDGWIVYSVSEVGNVADKQNATGCTDRVEFARFQHDFPHTTTKSYSGHTEDIKEILPQLPASQVNTEATEHVENTNLESDIDSNEVQVLAAATVTTDLENEENSLPNTHPRPAKDPEEIYSYDIFKQQTLPMPDAVDRAVESKAKTCADAYKSLVRISPRTHPHSATDAQTSFGREIVLDTPGRNEITLSGSGEDVFVDTKSATEYPDLVELARSQHDLPNIDTSLPSLTEDLEEIVGQFMTRQTDTEVTDEVEKARYMIKESLTDSETETSDEVVVIQAENNPNMTRKQQQHYNMTSTDVWQSATDLSDGIERARNQDVISIVAGDVEGEMPVLADFTNDRLSPIKTQQTCTASTDVESRALGEVKDAVAEPLILDYQINVSTTDEVEALPKDRYCEVSAVAIDSVPAGKTEEDPCLESNSAASWEPDDKVEKVRAEYCIESVRFPDFALVSFDKETSSATDDDGMKEMYTPCHPHGVVLDEVIKERPLFKLEEFQSESGNVDDIVETETIQDGYVVGRNLIEAKTEDLLPLQDITREKILASVRPVGDKEASEDESDTQCSTSEHVSPRACTGDKMERAQTNKKMGSEISQNESISLDLYDGDNPRQSNDVDQTTEKFMPRNCDVGELDFILDFIKTKADDLWQDGSPSEESLDELRRAAQRMGVRKEYVDGMILQHQDKEADERFLLKMAVSSMSSIDETGNIESFFAKFNTEPEGATIDEISKINEYAEKVATMCQASNRNEELCVDLIVRAKADGVPAYFISIMYSELFKKPAEGRLEEGFSCSQAIRSLQTDRDTSGCHSDNIFFAGFAPAEGATQSEVDTLNAFTAKIYRLWKRDRRPSKEEIRDVDRTAKSLRLPPAVVKEMMSRASTAGYAVNEARKNASHNEACAEELLSLRMVVSSMKSVDENENIESFLTKAKQCKSTKETILTPEMPDASVSCVSDREVTLGKSADMVTVSKSSAIEAVCSPLLERNGDSYESAIQLCDSISAFPNEADVEQPSEEKEPKPTREILAMCKGGIHSVVTTPNRTAFDSPVGLNEEAGKAGETEVVVQEPKSNGMKYSIPSSPQDCGSVSEEGESENLDRSRENKSNANFEEHIGRYQETLTASRKDEECSNHVAPELFQEGVAAGDAAQRGEREDTSVDDNLHIKMLHSDQETSMEISTQSEKIDHQENLTTHIIETDNRIVGKRIVGQSSYRGKLIPTSKDMRLRQNWVAVNQHHGGKIASNIDPAREENSAVAFLASPAETLIGTDDPGKTSHCLDTVGTDINMSLGGPQNLRCEQELSAEQEITNVLVAFSEADADVGAVNSKLILESFGARDSTITESVSADDWKTKLQSCDTAGMDIKRSRGANQNQQCKQNCSLDKDVTQVFNVSSEDAAVDEVDSKLILKSFHTVDTSIKNNPITDRAEETAAQEKAYNAVNKASRQHLSTGQNWTGTDIKEQGSLLEDKTTVLGSTSADIPKESPIESIDDEKSQGALLGHGKSSSDSIQSKLNDGIHQVASEEVFNIDPADPKDPNFSLIERESIVPEKNVDCFERTCEPTKNHIIGLHDGSIDKQVGNTRLVAKKESVSGSVKGDASVHRASNKNDLSRMDDRVEAKDLMLKKIDDSTSDGAQQLKDTYPPQTVYSKSNNQVGGRSPLSVEAIERLAEDGNIEESCIAKRVHSPGHAFVDVVSTLNYYSERVARLVEKSNVSEQTIANLIRDAKRDGVIDSISAMQGELFRQYRYQRGEQEGVGSNGKGERDKQHNSLIPAVDSEYFATFAPAIGPSEQEIDSVNYITSAVKYMQEHGTHAPPTEIDDVRRASESDSAENDEVKILVSRLPKALNAKEQPMQRDSSNDDDEAAEDKALEMKMNVGSFESIDEKENIQEVLERMTVRTKGDAEIHANFEAPELEPDVGSFDSIARMTERMEEATEAEHAAVKLDRTALHDDGAKLDENGSGREICTSQSTSELEDSSSLDLETRVVELIDQRRKRLIDKPINPQQMSVKRVASPVFLPLALCQEKRCAELDVGANGDLASAVVEETDESSKLNFVASEARKLFECDKSPTKENIEKLFLTANDSGISVNVVENLISRRALKFDFVATTKETAAGGGKCKDEMLNKSNSSLCCTTIEATEETESVESLGFNTRTKPEGSTDEELRKLNYYFKEAVRTCEKRGVSEDRRADLFRDAKRDGVPAGSIGAMYDSLTTRSPREKSNSTTSTGSVKSGHSNEPAFPKKSGGGYVAGFAPPAIGATQAEVDSLNYIARKAHSLYQGNCTPSNRDVDELWRLSAAAGVPNEFVESLISRHNIRFQSIICESEVPLTRDGSFYRMDEVDEEDELKLKMVASSMKSVDENSNIDAFLSRMSLHSIKMHPDCQINISDVPVSRSRVHGEFSSIQCISSEKGETENDERDESREVVYFDSSSDNSLTSIKPEEDTSGRYNGGTVRRENASGYEVAVAAQTGETRTELDHEVAVAAQIAATRIELECSNLNARGEVSTVCDSTTVLPDGEIEEGIKDSDAIFDPDNSAGESCFLPSIVISSDHQNGIEESSVRVRDSFPQATSEMPNLDIWELMDASINSREGNHRNDSQSSDHLLKSNVFREVTDTSRKSVEGTGIANDEATGSQSPCSLVEARSPVNDLLVDSSTSLGDASESKVHHDSIQNAMFTALPVSTNLDASPSFKISFHENEDARRSALRDAMEEMEDPDVTTKQIKYAEKVASMQRGKNATVEEKTDLIKEAKREGLGPEFIGEMYCALFTSSPIANTYADVNLSEAFNYKDIRASTQDSRPLDYKSKIDEGQSGNQEERNVVVSKFNEEASIKAVTKVELKEMHKRGDEQVVDGKVLVQANVLIGHYSLPDRKTCDPEASFPHALARCKDFQGKKDVTRQEKGAECPAVSIAGSLVIEELGQNPMEEMLGQPIISHNQDSHKSIGSDAVETHGKKTQFDQNGKQGERLSDQCDDRNPWWMVEEHRAEASSGGSSACERGQTSISAGGVDRFIHLAEDKAARASVQQKPSNLVLLRRTRLDLSPLSINDSTRWGTSTARTNPNRGIAVWAPRIARRPNRIPSNKVWKKSYEERTKAHGGYFDVDVFSMYSGSTLICEQHEFDQLPWEHRDVDQCFLHEKSVSLSRNWFGTLQRKRGNDRYHEPVCLPKSMKMPIEKIDEKEDWDEEWYTPWKSRKDSNAPGSEESQASQSMFDESEASLGRKSSGESDVANNSSVEYSIDEDGEPISWEEAPECGTIYNARQKIGERVTRVHPTITASLRRSRFRKKYFPRGTFPY